MSFTNFLLNYNCIKTYIVIKQDYCFRDMRTFTNRVVFFFSNLNLYEDTMSNSLNDLSHIIYYLF